MVKSYVLLLFIFCNLTNAIKVQVEFDELNKVIVHEGQIYLPLIRGSHSQDPLKGIFLQNSQIIKAHSEEGEPVTPAKYWFYIFMIVCKIYT